MNSATLKNEIRIEMRHVKIRGFFPIFLTFHITINNGSLSLLFLVMPIAQKGQFIPFHHSDAGKITATSVEVLCFSTERDPLPQVYSKTKELVTSISFSLSI